ncbi:MAG: energy-coupling factor transporter transmembrane protein EcfT [Lactobacillaceae bacterium]|jgi:energy-coupling factor transport system permease protein|nr:energy-coupling factor transporter transmembrane protein EcfT [Lactobacillaceae bacterium]
MNTNLFGRFIDTNSFIQRLDPRFKIVVNLLFTISVVLLNRPLSLLVAAVFVLLVVSLSRISLINYIIGLKLIIGIVIFSAALQLVFIRPTATQDLLFNIYGWTISKTAINNSIVVLVRFVLMIILTTAFTASTSSSQIAEAIRKLFLPLEKIKVPVENFSLMISIAIRFIPIIGDDYKTIVNAQKSRGLNFYTGGLIKRMKAFYPIIVPLLVQSINHALNLADVMTARGFVDSKNRTHFHQLHLTKRDYLSAVVVTSFIIAIIFLNYAKL